jgi:hypothetical protein
MTLFFWFFLPFPPFLFLNACLSTTY